MSELDKINQLLENGSAENNYLAMQLMLNVLNLTFEEAYAKLKLKNKDDALLNLNIGEINIEYRVDLQRIIYAASSYADIDRYVFFRSEQVEGSKKRMHADDDSILSLGEFGGVDELSEIQDDLAGLQPLIKDLWYKSETDKWISF
jgi:hypothetical protein